MGVGGQKPRRPQTMDTGVGVAVSIPASGDATATAAGTIWPLLPNLRMHIHQVGCFFSPQTTPDFVQCKDMAIQLLLLDQKENVINLPSGFNVVFVLAAANYMLNATLGFDGFALEAHGRPLLDLQSGFFIANATGIPMPQFAQIQAIADFKNQNTSAEGVQGYVSALLSWE